MINKGKLDGFFIIYSYLQICFGLFLKELKLSFEFKDGEDKT